MKHNLEQTILRWLPLFGPVPIAWTVYHATTTLMHWPWWVAIAAAVFVEGIGFSSINLAVRMRQFNSQLWEREKTKYTAPTYYAIVATGMYALTALLLAVLLEIIPDLRVWSPTSFILMSITGGFLYSLYGDQERRESEHSDARASRKRRSATRSDATSDAQRRSTSTNSRSAKKSATLSDAPAKIYRCVCGEEYTNRYKYSGHTRTCATYQSKKKGKLIPVEIPQKVGVEQ